MDGRLIIWRPLAHQTPYWTPPGQDLRTRTCGNQIASYLVKTSKVTQRSHTSYSCQSSTSARRRGSICERSYYHGHSLFSLAPEKLFASEAASEISMNINQEIHKRTCNVVHRHATYSTDMQRTNDESMSFHCVVLL